ncbi:histidinol-phosphate transaminase [Anaerovoracaceae bacterium 41-7]
MSKFLVEKYRKLKPYTPGEQPKDQVMIKLNTNESPYPPGPATIAALNAGEAANLRLYSDPDSSDLKQAIANLYRVQRNNVFVTNGSDDILNFAFMAFAGEGGKVYFPETSYGFYEVFADLYETDYVKVPLKPDFSIDSKDYVCKDGMIVIANPNAPTGQTLSLQQVEEIVRTNRDSVVLIDEAYVDFGADSAVELIHKYENLLVVQTFSKSRSMAGARLGFAIASAALVADLEKIKFSTNPYNVNRMTSAAGIAALSENEYYMENCRRIMETRAYTAEKLIAMGFEVVPSKANFLFAKSPDVDGGVLYEKLREKSILIRHFDKEAISQYNRITIGTREEMDCFLEAVSEILR